MRLSRWYLALLLVLGSGTVALAKSWTLADCVRTAVKRNPALRAQGIQVTITETDIASTYGPFNWTLSADVGFSYNDNPTFSRFDTNAATPGQTAISSSLDAYWNLKLSKKFISGTNLTVSWESDWARRTGQLYTTNRWYGGQISFTVSQNFLKGFPIFPNLADRLKARKLRSIEELRHTDKVNDVVLETVKAYWELLYAKEELKIRRTALQLAQTQVADTQARVSAGRLTQTDLLAAQHLAASREEQVLLAITNVSTQVERLRKSMGLPVLEANLDPRDKPSIAFQRPDLKQLLKDAHEHNYGLRIKRLELSRQRLETRRSKNDLLPTLALALTLGQNGLGASYPKNLEHIFKFKGGFGLLMLNFSYPFGNDTAKATHKKSRLTEEKIVVDTEEQRREVTLQVAKAARNVDLNRKRMKVVAALLTLSERKVEAGREQFKQGRITHQELLQHMLDLEDARVKRIRTLIDYEIAVGELSALRATLLSAFGVDVKK